jgi:hypothetical protein
MDGKQLDTQFERTTRDLVPGASRRRVLQAVAASPGLLDRLNGWLRRWGIGPVPEPVPVRVRANQPLPPHRG